MRLAIASDLHLEFGGVALTNTGAADVLVLAGDICVVRQLPLAWFFDVCESFRKVLYVPGNHEYYGSDIDLMLNRLRFDLSCFSNLHILANETVEIGEVTFAGSTLWTSIDNSNPLAMWDVRQGMSDFSQIHEGTMVGKIHNHPPYITPQRWCKEHEKAVQFLQEQKADVVITHFSPSYQSCSEEYLGSRLNPGFHTELQDLIINLSPFLWIHGHTHDRFDYMVEKTRVICNPRGYPEENSNWSLAYVEL